MTMPNEPGYQYHQGYLAGLKEGKKEALKERDEAVALIDELIKGISQYVDKCPKAFSNAFIILKKSRDEALEKIAQFKGGKG
jgi:hypothetical protein